VREELVTLGILNCVLCSVLLRKVLEIVYGLDSPNAYAFQFFLILGFKSERASFCIAFSSLVWFAHT
jgi:hypothetical protein